MNKFSHEFLNKSFYESFEISLIYSSCVVTSSYVALGFLYTGMNFWYVDLPNEVYLKKFSDDVSYKDLLFAIIVLSNNISSVSL